MRNFYSSKVMVAGVFVLIFLSAAGSTEIQIAGRSNGPIRIVPQATHRNGIQSLDFSPDGWLLASLSSDNTLRLWDAESGGLLRIVPASSEEYKAIFQAHGYKLLSTSSKGILVRDSSGAILRRDIHPKGNNIPREVIAHPQNNRIVAYSQGNKTYVWDIESESVVIGVTLPNVDVIQSIAFSSDGGLFAAGGSEYAFGDYSPPPDTKAIGIFEYPTGKPIIYLPGHPYGVRKIAFCGNDTLVSVGLQNDVCIWNVRTGTLLNKCIVGTEYPQFLESIDNGNKFIVGDQSAVVRIYDALSGEVIRRVKLNSMANVMALDPYGKRIAVAHGSDIRIYNLYEDTGSKRLGHTVSSAVELMVAADHILAAVTEDEVVRFMNLTTLDLKSTLFQGFNVSGLKENIDRTYLISENTSGNRFKWRISDGLLTHILGQKGGAKIARIHPSGKYVVVVNSYGSTGSFMSVWDATSGDRLYFRYLGKRYPEDIEFNPDGRYLGMISDDRIYVIDFSSWKIVRSFYKRRVIHDVNFSSDNRFVAASGEDQKIDVWSIETNEKMSSFGDDAYYKYNFSFHPNRPYIVTSEHPDNAPRMWDIERDTVIQVFEPLPKVNLHISAFSPDGAQIAVSVFERSLCIWDVPTGKRMFYSEAQAGGISRIAYRLDGGLIGTVGWYPGLGSHDGHIQMVNSTANIYDSSAQYLRRIFARSSPALDIRWLKSGECLIVGEDYLLRYDDVVLDPAIEVLLKQDPDTMSDMEAYRRPTSTVTSDDMELTIAGGNDGSIRFMNTGDSTLLLTLYNLPDGGWAAITPDGYFAGPAASEFFRGISGNDFVRPEDISDRFRPDIIRTRINVKANRSGRR